jgi:hypothetical protein
VSNVIVIIPDSTALGPKIRLNAARSRLKNDVINLHRKPTRKMSTPDKRPARRLMRNWSVIASAVHISIITRS